MTTSDLTARQEEVLDAIARLTTASGVPPTTRELASELGVHPNAVHGSLMRLRALDRVTWQEGRARTLRVVADGESGKSA